MFWSKIWLFVITLAAAAVLAIALVLPRPAQRTLVRTETTRLQTACSVIRILLADDARNRVDLTGAFARDPKILNALDAASASERLDEAGMKQARDIGDTVMKEIQGNRKPDFAMLIDRRGRVIARVRLDDNDFGDIAVGRPLVDDALAGYLRDDVWAQNGTIYFVSAAPAVKQGAYVGAVVLGHLVTNQLAQTLVKSLDVDMGFHLGGDGVAGSRTIAFDHAAMQAAIARLAGDPAGDCLAVRPIDLHAGAEDYTAIVARLPGEAAARQAYYSVIIRRPDTLGFFGTLRAVKDSDLSFGNFPWILVGGAFVIALAAGIGLLFIEVDRPLRRLADDAVRLAKGETERLSDDAHAGKLGSVARSVNIHIDKLGREARSARKDLDQLLGPAPDSGLGTIDLLATALPSVRPGGPAAASPPPPSEFRFTDASLASLRPPPPAPPARPSGPPTRPTPSAAVPLPPPVPGAAALSPVAPPSVAASQMIAPMADRGPSALDDDILGRGPGLTEPPPLSPIDPYFKQIFDQFLAMKRSCNESIAGLVYERFAEKLVKNREELMVRTGCRDVRFTVYVKDGKAALKATPIKDEV